MGVRLSGAQGMARDSKRRVRAGQIRVTFGVTCAKRPGRGFVAHEWILKGFLPRE